MLKLDLHINDVLINYFHLIVNLIKVRLKPNLHTELSYFRASSKVIENTLRWQVYGYCTMNHFHVSS